MSRRRRRNDWIPGAVITIIVIMLSVVFMGLLAMTKMIPTIYMLIIGIEMCIRDRYPWNQGEIRYIPGNGKGC